MARTTPSLIRVWTRFYAQFNTPSASTFEFMNSLPSTFNATLFTLRHYLLHFARLQFISSFNECIAVIIPVLTTFLQLKYQGTNNDINSPFATHPRAMRVAVSCSVFYYLAFVVLLRFPLRRFSVAACHCLILCGHASVASLASVFLPDWVSPFVYAIFTLIFLGDLLCCLYHKIVAEVEGGGFHVYRRRVRRFLNNICRVAANSPRPQRLPI